MSIPDSEKKKKTLATSTIPTPTPLPADQKATEAQTFKTAVYAAAKSYIGRGWLVFPIHSITEDGHCTCGKTECGSAGKHPRTPNGLKDASCDPAQIEEWFGPGAPLSNIGVATGKDSGVTVIDIDMGDGKVGGETWQSLTRDHGEPDTLMASTGGGGRHLFFVYAPDLKTGNNRLGKHVDGKSDGGYVVVSPSRHRSGGVYAWLNWGTELKPLPDYLHQPLPSGDKPKRGRPEKGDPLHRRYSVVEVLGMLAVIPQEDRDRDFWLAACFAMAREFPDDQTAHDGFLAWSETYDGPTQPGDAKRIHDIFFVHSTCPPLGAPVTLGTIIKRALKHGWAPKTGSVLIKDLLYVVEANEYLDRHTGKYWSAQAVDAAVSPMNEEGKMSKASEWLKRHRLVTSVANDPSFETDYIVGSDCVDGVLAPRQGRACYNTYRKPTVERGEAKQAEPFVHHCAKIFNKPGDKEQFWNYLAHCVQYAGRKIRFALLIAGGQGNGKDTAVELCLPAIGHWNVANIEPSAFESGFNEYEASTLVRINECANPQDLSKWAFNERTKVLIAGSPDHCTINPKYGVKYSARRHGGVVITTNHLASGIYIPQDDRRYDVIETATLEEMGLADAAVRRQYFEDLWKWFYAEGAKHVAAFLHARDLSGFSPDHGQRKTAAHQSVVQANMEADSWLLDILDELKHPTWVRSNWIETMAVAAGEPVLEVRKKYGHILGRAGYVRYRNPKRADGRWFAKKKGVALFCKVGTPALTEQEITALVEQECF